MDDPEVLVIGVFGFVACQPFDSGDRLGRMYWQPVEPVRTDVRGLRRPQGALENFVDKLVECLLD
ncbi:hypothetical protein [Mycobacteroides abscessus]|uniref:hypothetical protein n=1 Tax=Mycobacteroides abscessus TaxID=36809 RepID=UPI001039E136|nr:hypothetical protein [Mycobacteroides abscessus]